MSEDAEEKVTLQQAEAEAKAAAPGSPVQASVTRDVPAMIVEVTPGSVVSHGGATYYGEGYPLAPDDHEGADTLKLDGPTALALAAEGAVTIKGPEGQTK